MRQRTILPAAGAPDAVRSFANPGRDSGTHTDPAAGADQGAHGAAAGSDALS